MKRPHNAIIRKFGLITGFSFNLHFEITIASIEITLLHTNSHFILNSGPCSNSDYSQCGGRLRPIDRRSL